jgi:predicted DNA-binding transcriptional regulator AlpA
MRFSTSHPESRADREPICQEAGTPLARDFLTLNEFLELMAVPRSTFFRWKATGQAPRHYKMPNRQIRIRRSDFESWLSDREEPRAA